MRLQRRKEFPIYHLGNEINDITGGWKNGKTYATDNKLKNAGNLQCAAIYHDSNTSAESGFQTINKILTSQYNSINVDWDYTHTTNNADILIRGYTGDLLSGSLTENYYVLNTTFTRTINKTPRTATVYHYVSAHVETGGSPATGQGAGHYYRIFYT